MATVLRRNIRVGQTDKTSDTNLILQTITIRFRRRSTDAFLRSPLSATKEHLYFFERPRTIFLRHDYLYQHDIFFTARLIFRHALFLRHNLFLRHDLFLRHHIFLRHDLFLRHGVFLRHDLFLAPFNDIRCKVIAGSCYMCQRWRTTKRRYVSSSLNIFVCIIKSHVCVVLFLHFLYSLCKILLFYVIYFPNL